jgi:hypothetical protein
VRLFKLPAALARLSGAVEGKAAMPSSEFHSCLDMALFFLWSAGLRNPRIRYGSARLWRELRAFLSRQLAFGKARDQQIPFSVRHAWIAASVNTGCRLRLPVDAASHCVSGSNQIDNDPRVASAAL